MKTSKLDTLKKLKNDILHGTSHSVDYLLSEEVEKTIEGKQCTFTAFVVEAVRVALENLQEDSE